MRNIERILKPNKNKVAEQSTTTKVKKECIETIKTGNQQSIIYYKGFGSCIFKVPRAEPEVSTAVSLCRNARVAQHYVSQGRKCLMQQVKSS
jgi:hypothetical protein